jgi:hypothetical protein
MQTPDFQSRKRIIFALILIGIGALAVLQNTNMIDIGSIWTLWPFLLVAFGINHLIGTRNPSEIGTGIWLCFLGLWLYVSLEGVWGLSFGTSWPMLLIAWGLSMVWKSFFHPIHNCCHKEKLYVHS